MSQAKLRTDHSGESLARTCGRASTQQGRLSNEEGPRMLVLRAMWEGRRWTRKVQ